LSVAPEITVQNQITADSVVQAVGEQVFSPSPDKSLPPNSDGIRAKETITSQPVIESMSGNSASVTRPQEEQLEAPVSAREDVSESVSERAPEIVRETESRQTVSTLEG
jgi:hypothetical protein